MSVAILNFTFDGTAASLLQSVARDIPLYAGPRLRSEWPSVQPVLLRTTHMKYGVKELGSIFGKIAIRLPLPLVACERYVTIVLGAANW